MTAQHLGAPGNHTHSSDRRLISRGAIIVSWLLLATGLVVAWAGQPEVGSLAILAAASAGVAVVATTPRNPVGWVTAAASGFALIGLLAVSIVLAALHA